MQKSLSGLKKSLDNSQKKQGQQGVPKAKILVIAALLLSSKAV